MQHLDNKSKEWQMVKISLVLIHVVDIIQGSGVTVTLDARTVLIGHFVYNVTASDSEGDDISFSLTCSPLGCPFKIYDCKWN